MLKLLKFYEMSRWRSGFEVKADFETVPYSGGSSVEGQFSTPYGGISVDFMMMNQIIEFNYEE